MNCAEEGCVRRAKVMLEIRARTRLGQKGALIEDPIPLCSEHVDLWVAQAHERAADHAVSIVRIPTPPAGPPP
jgi:hypothetical protein